MSTTLLIGAGGALGAMARYLLSSLVTQVMGTQFPWGILCVNLAGCFAMGLVAGAGLQAIPLSDGMKAFLATGILGGFTTFSAFSLDAVQLVERGQSMDAALYVIASVAGSIAALIAGLALVRAVNP
ncbi:MAG: fluoride efflux transporter CrcB [Alphaproteobacteria bacterium]|nr:fluoride efflux transporter CrcB [Alphaproteobacteria bacterium]